MTKSQMRMNTQMIRGFENNNVTFRRFYLGQHQQRQVELKRTSIFKAKTDVRIN